MQNNKTIIITVGVLLALVAVVVALLLTRPSSEEVTTPPLVDTPVENEEEFNNVSGDATNSIIVNDQLPGDVLFYDNLNLAGDSFVVVRNDVDGEPGEVIGVEFVESGADATGNVELEEPTAEGETYYVELYADTDGDGTFEEGVDEPITTEDNNVIRVQITTTEDLPESKG